MTDTEKIIVKTLKKWAERDLYSIEQAAHRLGVSRARIKPDLIATGLLGVVIINGKMKVPKCEIESFVKSNTKYVSSDRLLRVARNDNKIKSPSSPCGAEVSFYK